MYALMNYVGKRKRFVAQYTRLGKKRQYGGKMVETMLLEKIIDMATGEELKDHSWIEVTPEIKKVNFSKGDWLCFDASVETYVKGMIPRANQKIEKRPMTLEAGLFGFQNIFVLGNQNIM